jgi:hypothetical protein
VYSRAARNGIFRGGDRSAKNAPGANRNRETEKSKHKSPPIAGLKAFEIARVAKFPTQQNRELFRRNREFWRRNREFSLRKTKSVFGTTCNTRALRADFIPVRRRFRQPVSNFSAQGTRIYSQVAATRLIRIDCRLIHTKRVLARGWSALGQGVGPEFGPGVLSFPKTSSCCQPGSADAPRLKGMIAGRWIRCHLSLAGADWLTTGQGPAPELVLSALTLDLGCAALEMAARVPCPDAGSASLHQPRRAAEWSAVGSPAVVAASLCAVTAARKRERGSDGATGEEAPQRAWRTRVIRAWCRSRQRSVASSTR